MGRLSCPPCARAAGLHRIVSVRSCSVLVQVVASGGRSVRQNPHGVLNLIANLRLRPNPLPAFGFFSPPPSFPRPFFPSSVSFLPTCAVFVPLLGRRTLLTMW